MSCVVLELMLAQLDVMLKISSTLELGVMTRSRDNDQWVAMKVND